MSSFTTKSSSLTQNNRSLVHITFLHSINNPWGAAWFTDAPASSISEHRSCIGRNVIQGEKQIFINRIIYLSINKYFPHTIFVGIAAYLVKSQVNFVMSSNNLTVMESWCSSKGSSSSWGILFYYMRDLILLYKVCIS